MKCRLTTKELLGLLNHQLNTVWGVYQTSFSVTNLLYIETALQRSETCFSASCSSYYWDDDGQLQFQIENSVQYGTFLYYLSNTLYKAGETEKAAAVYYLNKIMHSVELFYAVELPEHFCMEHPLGSVMGRAKYGDYFIFYQGCTVGGNIEGDKITYPVLGDYVTMYSNSKILGNCHIGNNVIIGANAYIKDMDVPDDSMVFGVYPNVVIKANQRPLILENVRMSWKV